MAGMSMRGDNRIPAAKRRQQGRKTSIDDLPNEVLLEILSQLPCCKSFFRTKLVSKRWSALKLNPNFIGRFVRIESDLNNHSEFRNRTLISVYGDEFLGRMSSSSSQPLSPLFNRIMSFHGLKEKPVVEATYSDLVLCCATIWYQRDFYICNPYTLEWLPLPPPPQYQLTRYAPVGLMCDLPYYNCKRGDDHVVQLNPNYHCTVTRLISLDMGRSGKFQVQIFSSKTGEWKVSTLCCPLPVSVFFYEGRRRHVSPFSYKGMLFWGPFLVATGTELLLGLDPFMINGDQYKCCFKEIKAIPSVYQCLGEYNGGLRICLSAMRSKASVRDLTEKQIQSGDLNINHPHLIYELNPPERIFTEEKCKVGNKTTLWQLGVDPNDEDILYFQRAPKFLYEENTLGDIFRCKISTKDWLKIAGKYQTRMWNCPLPIFHFPLVIPWWPTPLPRLPQQNLAAHLN